MRMGNGSMHFPANEITNLFYSTEYLIENMNGILPHHRFGCDDARFVFEDAASSVALVLFRIVNMEINCTTVLFELSYTLFSLPNRARAVRSTAHAQNYTNESSTRVSREV